MENLKLHELDVKLQKYLNYNNGIFIEAGANDGIVQSNTALLERTLGWTGLLIEPNYTKSCVCAINRPNSIIENYALVSNNYLHQHVQGNFDEVLDYMSLMAMVVDDSSDWSNQYVVDRKNFMKTNRNIVSVPAITLTSLLKKHNIVQVDFFSLDVEGYELSVLNGLDFNYCRPKYILLETSFNRTGIIEYMNQQEYAIIEENISSVDDLFIDARV